MSKKFDYFVVFAEMRTGSNFLETNINAFPSLACHGEAFNPHFIGYPNRDTVLGVTLEERALNPTLLINAIKDSDLLAGFRFFHDHDPRVLDYCLSDPRCAKIILIRNPLDSYVSWKIAKATGQWKLTDITRRKSSKVHFDGAEFKRHVENLQEFQVTLIKKLQLCGQTAFYVAYEDLQDVQVMNGLAKFLGVDEELKVLDRSLKPQNPSPMSAKVSNYEQLAAGLAELDRFNLTRTPNFEPRRGPSVPTYLAGAVTPLLYLPTRSGPEEEVARWLASLDGVPVEKLLSHFNQKDLRHWKRTHVGHRTFSVIRHPALRVHHAFCQHILRAQSGRFRKIQKTLRKVYKLSLPEDPLSPEYDVAAHKKAFVGFLNFVKANLAGQTALRQDAHWATQSGGLRGFGDLALPDMIIREDEMCRYLPVLAKQVGRNDVPKPNVAENDKPFSLSDIYDAEIEDLIGNIYQRDFWVFGFDCWK